jgi:hypothetical protein
MLIDLYERPYSPEAPKSRAFIDKIFSLSGPDGGVVGGEDGVSTQRPLKDGGREAWNMIRRLRQKAWQRAGLDPHKLWTEKAQMQAGLAPVDEYGLTDPYSPHGTAGSPAMATPRRPAGAERQLTDFSKTFYGLTRSQTPSSRAASPGRPSPLPHRAPPDASPAPGTPALSPPFPDASKAANRPLDTAADTGPGGTAQFNSAVPGAQASAATPPASLPFVDAASPNGQSVGVAPTPPSMVDPNLNFDWDQWDAVFGQHLPVADDLMELDPVMGLDLGDLGNVRKSGGFGDVQGPWSG